MTRPHRRWCRPARHAPACSARGTLLLTAAWHLAPRLRFVLIPAVIVTIYALTIRVLERRWRGSGRRSAAASTTV